MNKFYFKAIIVLLTISNISFSMQCISFPTNISCDDIIYLKDGAEIEGKVIEVSETQIIYILCGDDTNEQEVVSKSKVFMIKYSNGTKEMFNTIAFKAENDISKHGYFIDTRDSTRYKTIQIGEQIWFAENLKYKIPKQTKYIKYKEIINDSLKHGIYYTWEAACNACPSGWHLPSQDDIVILAKWFGYDDIRLYHFLKNGGDSGFNGLLGGYITTNTTLLNPRSVRDFEEKGYWWLKTEDFSNTFKSYTSIAKAFGLSDYYQDAKIYSWGKGVYLNIRCIKDK